MPKPKHHLLSTPASFAYLVSELQKFKESTFYKTSRATTPLTSPTTSPTALYRANMEFKYQRSERKVDKEDMSLDVVFEELAKLNVKVQKAHNLLISAQSKQISKGQVDIKRLYEGIVKVNGEFDALMAVMVTEGTVEREVQKRSAQTQAEGNGDGEVGVRGKKSRNLRGVQGK